MRRLSDTDNRYGGVEDDGDPVPSRHQSDVSPMGHVPSTTKAQSDARRVAPWPAPQVMDVRPDQRCTPPPCQGPSVFLLVDVAGLLQLDEPPTHGSSGGHTVHRPHQSVVKPSLSGEGTVPIPVWHTINARIEPRMTRASVPCHLGPVDQPRVCWPAN
jgi:hypothetical protein